MHTKQDERETEADHWTSHAHMCTCLHTQQNPSRENKCYILNREYTNTEILQKKISVEYYIGDTQTQKVK